MKEAIMFSLPSNSGVSTQAQSFSLGNSTRRGILIGFVPLALLIVLVAIALAVTALVRQFFAPSGFFVEQQAVLITLGSGLVIGLVIFVVAIVLSLWRVTAWQKIGATKSVNAALWALGITAFVMFLPVLLAIVLPQNTAP